MKVQVEGTFGNTTLLGDFLNGRGVKTFFCKKADGSDDYILFLFIHKSTPLLHINDQSVTNEYITAIKKMQVKINAE